MQQVASAVPLWIFRVFSSRRVSVTTLYKQSFLAALYSGVFLPGNSAPQIVASSLEGIRSVRITFGELGPLQHSLHPQPPSCAPFFLIFPKPAVFFLKLNYFPFYRDRVRMVCPPPFLLLSSW